jgi:hypothetical protein
MAGILVLGRGHELGHYVACCFTNKINNGFTNGFFFQFFFNKNYYKKVLLYI